MFKVKCLGVMVCVAFLLLTGVAMAAQSSQNVQLGNVSGIPVEKWVGNIFTVLPLPQPDQGEVYSFTLVNSAPNNIVDESGKVRADWLAGKKLEVQSVKFLANNASIDDCQVVFRETTSGVILTAQAISGQVPHLVLSDDLTNARKYFMGKTVFSKPLAISAYQTTPHAITVTVDEPLRVVDVVPGVTASEPIWLVVTTPDNVKCFIPIAFSNTNTYWGFWTQGNPWSAVIAEKNPLDAADGNKNVRAEIASGSIALGMSPDQVRVAWGEPQFIGAGATSAEQMWFYPGKLLKFNASGLYSIEDR